MRIQIFFAILFSCFSLVLSQSLQQSPPFSGTIFIDPDIITSSDSSAFQSVTYTGQGSRTMFDRRVNNWINVNAFLFTALFLDGLSAEIQVNPEFGTSELALVEAQKYGPIIGRLPTSLRSSVQTVWIHKGIQPFGGGNNNILIHTGQTVLYENDGILEETLIHEASHTSLDAAHAESAGWLSAQTADNEFISTYARDNPVREDIAESFLTFLAVRYKPSRISVSLSQTITQTIPNRIAYFDKLPLAMYPLSKPTTGFGVSSFQAAPASFNLFQNYPNPFNPSTTLRYSIPERCTIRLSIFNTLGQKISDMVNETQDAGNYETTFNASQFSSGIYFYTIEAASEIKSGRTFSETKKMVLIR